MQRTDYNTKPNRKLEIVNHWKLIFFTYSFWLYAASAILTFLEQVLPFFNILQPALTEKEYVIGMFLLNIAALLAKFIRQHKNEQRRKELEENENANIP